MSKTLPKIEDIALFSVAGKNRSDNSQNNQARENVIANLYSLNESYYLDAEYGEAWKNLKENFDSAISSMCVDIDVTYDRISLKQMGGRKYNYDFEVSYLSENEIVKSIKLEFKHNMEDMLKLPQFLELSDKDIHQKYELAPVQYLDYFYRNYLGLYLQCDPELCDLEIPDAETYSKNVFDIQYKHPFFRKLYENKSNQLAQKRKIVNESMKTYIEANAATFDFSKLAEKMRKSQTDKIFLLWDCNKFNIYSEDTSKLEIAGIKKINGCCIDVNVANFKHDIRIRLNWGNNLGIANPRWKFSFIHKSGDTSSSSSSSSSYALSDK